MDDDERFGAMVDACLEAHEAVAEVGTPAMLVVIRGLLWEVGHEIGVREMRKRKAIRYAHAQKLDGKDPSSGAE